jgi:hypothetical protein
MPLRKKTSSSPASAAGATPPWDGKDKRGSPEAIAKRMRTMAKNAAKGKRAAKGKQVAKANGAARPPGLKERRASAIKNATLHLERIEQAFEISETNGAPLDTRDLRIATLVALNHLRAAAAA